MLLITIAFILFAVTHNFIISSSGSATIKSTLHSWRTVQELNWKRSIDDGDVSGNEEQEIVESIDSVKISSNSNSEEIRPFVSLLDIPGIEKELQSLNLNNKETRDILQLIPGMSHQLSLISSTGKLKYTNYTDTYKECLDHIFITNKNLEVVRVAEQPSEEILAEEIALPSSVFPSDHISLSVDLKFKQ